MIEVVVAIARARAFAAGTANDGMFDNLNSMCLRESYEQRECAKAVALLMTCLPFSEEREKNIRVETSNARLLLLDPFAQKTMTTKVNVVRRPLQRLDPVNNKHAEYEISMNGMSSLV